MSRSDERLSITLPPELKEQLTELANKNQRSLIGEATIAIKNHIERESLSESEKEEQLMRLIELALSRREYTAKINQKGISNNAVIGK